MSKPVSKTAIGAFVVGACIIIAAVVVVIGTGTLFSQKHYCVSFFEGSVQGLSVGAPVKFRGVEIGAVTKIVLTSVMVEQDGEQTRQVTIPVFYEIYDQQLGSKDVSRDEFEKSFDHMVRNGLRSQMQMQSIITGQYFIQLDFYPGDDPVYVYKTMPNKPEGLEDAIEIPAVTTGLAKLSKTIDKLPLEEILGRLDDSLAGLQNILNSDSTKKLVKELGPMAASLNNVIVTLEKELGPALQAVTGAAQGLENNSQQLGTVLGDVHKVLANADRSMQNLSGSLQKTLVSLQDTSQEVSAFAAGESPLGHQLTDTLKELRQLSFNLNTLIKMLEDNPSALVWGK